ncbi:hypothetical protein SDC9_103924 [bioreactor metagenome]|uniref:Uncharacterized protein n=1 Tax=bioreactor metagenome TaxID=1076179 RepID=A0A645AWC5_9ZZZZ
MGDLHLQGVLDGAQMGICRAAEVGEAGVVVGGEGVAQDHADNLVNCAAKCG